MINLRELRRAGKKELSIQESFTYDDLPLTQPVQVRAILQLTSTGATVNGKLDAIIEEPCDRCFEPFPRNIHTSFNETFVYQSLVDPTPTGDMELHNEDFYDVIGADGILDLHDLIHQFIVLAMSTDRVCEKETCEMQIPESPEG